MQNLKDPYIFNILFAYKVYKHEAKIMSKPRLYSMISSGHYLVNLINHYLMT
jgi:hypothetical protein